MSHATSQITRPLRIEIAGVKVSRIKSIKCAKCGKEYDEENVPANDGCGGRIDFTFDLEALKEIFTKQELFQRKSGLWKYYELMPLRSRRNIVTLGEGDTPYLQSGRLADEWGMKNLFLKNEIFNPSGSFKDRPICVGVSRALEDGAKPVSAASSGNAAAAMSSYAARAGLQSVVFVPEDAPAGKLIHLRTLGAKVFRVTKVQEGVDPTTTLLKAACTEFGWTPSPSFGPFNCFQFEGTKSLGYEIAEQSEWNPPDWILFPTGSGGLMAGTMKGLWEFKEMGLIDRLPRPVVVQPEGCPPLVHAFNNQQDPMNITPWNSNETVAGGLADPFPWDGDAALKYLRLADGKAIAVSDDAIEEALVALGKFEGIFAEPSGVAALAGLRELMDQGVIDSTDHVVVPITGSGFKDLATPDRLTPGVPVIPPDTSRLKKALENY
ncbi:MAG: threonine synthase [Candidatus Thorarchaeota archaeon]|nr:MAG: threonine synthase [Candidatus Thorarchaeota archaeon]